MRAQNARPRFNKSFGDAPAIHVVGHHLPQMVLNAAEVYLRKWNTQFAMKASGMIQRIMRSGLILRRSHERSCIECRTIILIQFSELTLNIVHEFNWLHLDYEGFHR